MRESSIRGRLGERLIANGLINQDQLKLALEEQKKTGEPLGEVFQKLGYVSEEEILSILAEQAGVERINLDDYVSEPEALRLVPEAFARSHTVIPLFKENNCLTVAIADPFDIMTIEEMERLTNLRVDTKAAAKTEILKAIDRSYGESREGREHPREIEELFKERSRVKIGEQRKREGLATMAPVIQLVDQTIIQAVKEGATDIHF